MALPILATKLYIPRLTERIIQRHELVTKLVCGFHDNRKLTFVCAPAGYGKTTLALEFLQKVQTPVAWISHDDGDNDTHRFLSYLIAALNQAGMVIGDDFASLINESGINVVDSVLTMLINSISLGPGKTVLVLDDYHLIQSQKIHDLIKFLMEYQPPNLHLVILSREDPPLPLAKLRMKGEMTEVRVKDLQFSQEEVSQLFQNTINFKLSDNAVKKVTTRTEGWIAGLQLAGLVFKTYREDQVEETIQKFDGSNTYIIDYLVEEVLTHQSPEIRDFLCKTSVLERMNASLCSELTQISNSREILSQIEKANLFLIPLDNQRKWYRYHHLFADSLKSSLSREDEAALYQKAAIWMKANGFSHEAIRYAFKSGNQGLALQLVEETVEETFMQGQLDSLIGWIENFPDHIIRKSEALSVRKAIAYLATGRFPEAVQYIRTLDEAFMKNASSHNRGLLLSIQAMIAGSMGQDSEHLAEEALNYLEDWDPIARTSTLNTLGRAQWRNGKNNEAIETFKKAYASGMKLGYQFVTTLALMNYSACLCIMGQKSEALDLCQHYLESMQKHFDKLPPYIGILYVTMGEIYARLGNLDKAGWYKEQGTLLCQSISYDATGSLKLFFETKEDGRASVLEYGEKLSERETEILKLLTKGLSNNEIAKTLFISLNTTQWHISHIYAKLGVRSRTQAILKAKEIF